MASRTEQTPRLTPAGAALLARFLDCEARGRLASLRDFRGPAEPGMPLPHGDGGALAAAQRLQRQGFAVLVGRRHHRFLRITDAGRSEVANAIAAALRARSALNREAAVDA
jgi:hypothetical protein